VISSNRKAKSRETETQKDRETERQRDRETESLSLSLSASLSLLSLSVSFPKFHLFPSFGFHRERRQNLILIILFLAPQGVFVFLKLFFINSIQQKKGGRVPTQKIVLTGKKKWVEVSLRKSSNDFIGILKVQKKNF
jgi:hypothetical protein